MDASQSKWFRYQKSIYGATRSEFRAPEDCRLTQRDKRLYLHVFSWPMEALYLDGLAQQVEYAQLLNDGSEIRMRAASSNDGYSDSDTLILQLPIQRPDVLVPVIELFLK